MQSDTWAVGCLLYELCTLRFVVLPFDQVLRIEDLGTGTTSYFKLRSIAWTVQCGTVLEISSTYQGLPCSCLQLDSALALPCFVRWVEGNDEDALKESLRSKHDRSGMYLENFCQLVRAFKCVNKRLLTIVLDVAWLCNSI